MADAPMANVEQAPARIVVGIDGSGSSKIALAWAARQARSTQAPLHVVITWELPVAYGWAVPLPADLDLAASAREVVDKAVEEVVGLGPAQQLELTVSVVEGHPAAVLLEESKSAALVVVGSRGHGSFAGMLLGSVGLHLAGHASCPVVIVPEVTAT